MSQGMTPIYGFRFPKPTDDPNVPRDIRRLAEDVEGTISGSLAVDDLTVTNDLTVGGAIVLAGLPLIDQDTYTPELAGSTSDPNLGADGLATGAWHRIGVLINGWFLFQLFGTGADSGSGALTISLPFGADESIMPAEGGGTGDSFSPGTAWFRSSTNGGTQVASLRMRGGGEEVFAMQSGDTATISQPSSGDWRTIRGHFTYIADPAGLL